jgi:hypothetical protein
MDEGGGNEPPVGSIFWDAVEAGLATAFSPVPEAAQMRLFRGCGQADPPCSTQDSEQTGYRLAVVHNNETPLSPVRDDTSDFA